MDDLISELFELKKLEPENNAISGLIELAKKCKSEVHTYIVFYGD